MPVFVAKRYDGKTLDVVLSATVELANAYWHGKDIIPHTVRSISDQDLAGHPTGVLPIVSTREVSVKRVGDFNYHEMLLID